MKVETKKSPEFKPVSIVITMESIRDAQLMWSLFNTNKVDLTDFINAHRSVLFEKFTKEEIDTLRTWDTWDFLDKVLNDNGCQTMPEEEL